MTNTTNTTNTAQARMPEFHFARLLHDDPLAIRSQWRSGDSVRREVQGRLLLDLSRDTVLAVHEAPMALAAVDTYLATLAAHHARCEEIDARADEEHNDRVARWERHCQIADDRGEERPPRPRRMDQRKPDPPRMHEHKIHARSIEATRDEPQRITFEVIARDGAETYRMGRIKLSVRGCPVIIAAGGALRLAVPFRCEVDEDAWALLEATQRETVEAVSPYVSDASGQMVWNAALDGVASMAEATTDVSEFHAALKSEGWTATFVTPNGDRYVATGDDPQTGVTP